MIRIKGFLVRVSGIFDKGSRIRGFKDSSEILKTYKELKVWQKSDQLCLKIYRITAGFPQDEKFGLTSQIRRASVSIPSNIAEAMDARQQEIMSSIYIFPMDQFVNWKRR